MLDGFRPKSGGQPAAFWRLIKFGERTELCSVRHIPKKWCRASGSGQKQVGKRKQGRADPGGDQDIIGPEVTLDVERKRMFFSVHGRFLGRRNQTLCELVHIWLGLFAAGSAVRLEQGRKMGQRLTTWQSGSGDRLWLSLLIDAMEEAARPEVRSQPCESALLQALRAQLAQPVGRYGFSPSAVRH